MFRSGETLLFSRWDSCARISVYATILLISRIFSLLLFSSFRSFSMENICWFLRCHANKHCSNIWYEFWSDPVISCPGFSGRDNWRSDLNAFSFLIRDFLLVAGVRNPDTPSFPRWVIRDIAFTTVHNAFFWSKDLDIQGFDFFKFVFFRCGRQFVDICRYAFLIKSVTKTVTTGLIEGENRGGSPLE